MSEQIEMIDKSLHTRLKHHFVKHGKKIGEHVRRHHKKYTFGAAIYSVCHLAIIKVLALKFLVFKVFFSILAILGIYESPMMNTFAQIENICVNNKPIIAQDKCEKNFKTIQEAVAYIEDQVDPETDTIYNAGHYSILSSMLKEYCGNSIDKSVLKSQIALFKSIYKIKDSATKIDYTKNLYKKGKSIVATTELSGKNEFCTVKYNGYNMLSMSQREFLKEFKKKGLLTIAPLSGVNSSKSDMFILSTFYKKEDTSYKSDIHYLMSGYKDTYAQTLANVIKNRTLKSVDATILALKEKGILTQKEIDAIADVLVIEATPSCDKNTGIHVINQYYNNKGVLIDTKLQKIQLNIHLCKSYQYIDELEINVPKILIHEIGHYVYSFKDKTANRFENICRNNTSGKQYNKCESSAFVTNYSKTNAEEDYAETFSRWALSKINENNDDKTDIKQTSTEKSSENVHGAAVTSVAYTTSVGQTTSIDKKFSYFDGFLQKTKRLVLGY